MHHTHVIDSALSRNIYLLAQFCWTLIGYSNIDMIEWHLRLQILDHLVVLASAVRAVHSANSLKPLAVSSRSKPTIYMFVFSSRLAVSFSVLISFFNSTKSLLRSTSFCFCRLILMLKTIVDAELPLNGVADVSNVQGTCFGFCFFTSTR